MVGKPSLFFEDIGRQIHDPFLLAISRRQFCEPRFVKNSRTVKRRPNIVTKVAHKSSASKVWKDVLRVEQDTKLFYIVLSILRDQG